MEWSEMGGMEWVFVLYPCFFMANMYNMIEMGGLYEMGVCSGWTV